MVLGRKYDFREISGPDKRQTSFVVVPVVSALIH